MTGSATWEWSSTVAVAVAPLLLLLLLCGWQRLAHPDPEWLRKGLHVGGGLLALGLPYWLDSAWQLLPPALAWLGLFALLRRGGRLQRLFGSILAGVGRRTHGEFTFVVAVVLLFWLARERPALYGAAVLVLTVADGAAALVGRRWGRVAWSFAEGKSVEGSLTFLVCAWLMCWLPLALLVPGPADGLVLVAAVTALLATVAEAITGGGYDNLVVPLLVLALLQLLPGLPPDLLLVLMAALLLLIVAAHTGQAAGKSIHLAR